MRTSYSRLETWEKCEWGYHLEYDEKILTAFNPFAACGRAIHSVFESDGTAIMTHGQGLPAASLFDAFDAFWQRETAVVGHHRNELTPYVERALAVIRAYVEQFQPYFRPVEVEREVLLTLGAHTLKGRRDAVVIDKEGRRHLIDYKTGKPWTKKKVADSHQMTLYCLADQAEHGADGATSGSFVFFDGPNDAIKIKVLSTDRTPAAAEAMLTHIDMVAGQMTQAEEVGYQYGLRGRSPFPCAYCTVEWACEVGQRHLEQIGKEPLMIEILP